MMVVMCVVLLRLEGLLPDLVDGDAALPLSAGPLGAVLQTIPGWSDIRHNKIQHKTGALQCPIKQPILNLPLVLVGGLVSSALT
jgi:hypothetical protein